MVQMPEEAMQYLYGWAGIEIRLLLRQRVIESRCCQVRIVPNYPELRKPYDVSYIVNV